MGWNTVKANNGDLLLGNMREGSRFYFAHSYHVLCNKNEQIAATTDYGYDFVSAFQRDNIIGVQFHPEKSHTFGMGILRNFVEFKC
jgi:glutamine amidotransferase